jgi:hypothetical protein
LSVRERLIKGAAPHLEPGENVRNAVSGISGPKWVLVFGALGALATTPRAVVLTNRHVYVMKLKGMNKPSEVEFKYPAGSVPVALGSGIANVPLTVGSEKVWISKVWRREAEALAANAGTSN